MKIGDIAVNPREVVRLGRLVLGDPDFIYTPENVIAASYRSDLDPDFEAKMPSFSIYFRKEVVGVSFETNEEAQEAWNRLAEAI